MAIEPSKNHPIDCGLATTSNFARQFAKQTVANRSADIDFEVEYTPISSGSSAPITIGDSNYIQNTYPTSATNIRVLVNIRPEKFPALDNISSKNNEILSQSESDQYLFEYQSTGETAISAVFTSGETVLKKVETKTLAETATFNEFQNFISGSLAHHIFNQTQQYADNSTQPPNHYSIYSTFDFVNNVFVRNTGHWLYPLDFSGVSVNRSGSVGGVRSVVAITPYHAIGAHHYTPYVGDVYYFCDSNNQTVSRTVASVMQVQFSEFGRGTDIAIVKFSEALPSTVKKYKTLPSTFSNYLPVNFIGYNYNGNETSVTMKNIPTIPCSHYRWDNDWPLQRPNRYAYFYKTQSGPVYDFVGIPQNFLAAAPDYDLPNYNGEPSGIQGGDSGLPNFFIINNDLVLTCNHYFPASGQLHASFLSNIQATINALGPSGQTYQTVDLSGFTNFSS